MGKDRYTKEKKRERSISPQRKSLKKKKKHKRYSSSESSDEEVDKKQSAYEKELQLLKEERRKKKEMLKAIETPEERRIRRQQKKEAKGFSRLAGVSDLGYTNMNNPFGDSNLTEAFVWKKKDEHDGIRDSDGLQQKKRHEQKQRDLKDELEKVKKRRQDREAEKAARDEEMELMQRQKEAAMFSSWEKQEDEFHLHQARLRSNIRIRDGRAKPIDLLAAYINPDDDDLEIQMHEPYSALVGLSIDDLEDLIEDIKIYITIDKKKNLEFWQDITTIAGDELEKLKKQRNQEAASGRREVINSAVQTDVNQIFRGKTHTQLVALQNQIKEKIKSGGSIDVGYWESLLQQLKAFMAKARLKERHQKLLKKKLDELKMETGPDDQEVVPDKNHQDTFKMPEIPSEKQVHVNEGELEAADNDGDDDNDDGDKKVDEEGEMAEKLEIQRLTEAELTEKAMLEYEEQNYEPKLISFADIDEEKGASQDVDVKNQEQWLNPPDDNNKLTYLREKVKSGSTVEEELERDNMFHTDVLKMNENEEAFNTTVKLTKKYNWSDKYRPRKPRFFNRVHTGYEWNKYNQTHYDQDNPPPKIVQGYKFNIFYPDIIDKTKTPEYTLTACEDDPDFAILRFKAGPPYEDIAFKVVDREWECSNRHGFRCQFYNNIFQLYFHFKRYRYRR